MAITICQLPLWTQPESPPSSNHKRKHKCAHPDCDKLVGKSYKHCRKHGAMIRANTPDGRKRMSKAAKAQIVNPFQGHTHSDATKAILKEKNTNRTVSEETCEKISIANMGHPTWNKGIPKPQAEKDQISATLRSMSEHLSKKAKERVENETEEQRERRLTNWIKAGRTNALTSNTSIEVFLAQYLDSLGIAYESQKEIGYYCIDFYLPAYNIALEAQGCYWHGCLQCGFDDPIHLAKRRADQIRYFILTRQGYKVKTVWEHDIRKAMKDDSYILQLFD